MFYSTVKKLARLNGTVLQTTEYKLHNHSSRNQNNQIANNQFGVQQRQILEDIRILLCICHSGTIDEEKAKKRVYHILWFPYFWRNLQYLQHISGGYRVDI
jgi:hypothetical protein